MHQPPDTRRFPLAPMSGPLRLLSGVVLLLPLVFLAYSVTGKPALSAIGAGIAALYAWTWLRMRPRAFVIGTDRLNIEWPLRREQIALDNIRAAGLLVDGRALQARVGGRMRVGVGGLWGAFGKLYTRRRGMVRLYVSRLDNYVWLELHNGMPWLITPDRPDAFLARLGKPALDNMNGEA